MKKTVILHVTFQKQAQLKVVTLKIIIYKYTCLNRFFYPAFLVTKLTQSDTGSREALVLDGGTNNYKALLK